MIDLKQYGYTGEEVSADDMIPGRVTEHRRDQYIIITERGEVSAVLKGTFYLDSGTTEFPCVGDFVLLHYNETGVSRIAKLLPRWSKFSRSNFSGRPAGYVRAVQGQVVATNFDYVFIFSSLNFDFNVNRIMRYLTLAWQSGGQPVVILTKADLLEDYSAEIAEVQEIAQGAPIHAVSSQSGYGLSELNKYLQPKKTVVLLGMSGVGKSSLLNTLMGKNVMAVRDIREADSRGRHTTTHRQLFMLPSGAMIIDTPGMRELGLQSADEGISTAFADVEELITECRFSNCRHQTEPGCAVLAALDDGSLSREHWERYLKQTKENKLVEDRVSALKESGMRRKPANVGRKRKKK